MPSATAFGRTKEESDEQYVYLSFTRDLNLITAADVVTDFPLDFYGEIAAFRIVVTDPVTTASDAASFNLEINSTDVGGSTIATTSANMTPAGTVLSATPTSDYSFGPEDTLSIEASAVTDYAEGACTFVVVLKRKG